MAPSGDAIAELDGIEVHIPGLLSGERARVRIEHRSRHKPKAFAKLLELVETSDFRVAPPCTHQEDCSACPLMIATASAQRDEKRAMLKKQFGLAVDVVVPAPQSEGYRWSSKRVVGGRQGRLHLGSYRRGTHELAHMDHCLVEHPDIVSTVQQIQATASAMGIEPYDEATGGGDLRYVWLKTNGRGEVLLTLVSGSAVSRAEELAGALTGVSGVAHCVQGGAGNAIRGGDLRVLSGIGTLTVELLGERVEVGPLGFLQPNPAVAAMAYADLLDEQSGELAFDLYAGAGVTTGVLRKRFKRVLACESYPESAATLGVKAQTVEAFLRDVGEQEPSWHPEFIVANPPRAGFGPAVIEQLNDLARRSANTPRLHVMSCSPASMARDLRGLTEGEGRYRLSRARAYDTLPHTPHLELVICLEGI